jgi:hypothetical protein
MNAYKNLRDKVIITYLSLLVVVIILFFSDSRELSYKTCKTNNPPLAVAGPNAVIMLPMNSVSLDGSTSTDPEGSIIFYKWSKILF